MLRTYQRKKKSKLPYFVVLAAIAILFIWYSRNNVDSSKVESQESQKVAIESNQSEEPEGEIAGMVDTSSFSVDSLFSFIKGEFPDYVFEVSENSFQWVKNGKVNQIEGMTLLYVDNNGIDRIEQVVLDYLYTYNFDGNSENSVISDGGRNVLGLVSGGMKCKLTTDSSYFELGCGEYYTMN